MIQKLRTAYDCFLHRNFDDYHKLMRETKMQIDALSGADDLLGEWTLLTSLPYIMEPQKLIPIYEEALWLMKGRSRVISRKESLLLNEYSPLVLLWREAGKAEETGRSLEKAAGLYQKLTGSGTAVSTLYQAQLAHFRGDFENAEHLARKTIMDSREDMWSLAVLGAAEMMCVSARCMDDPAGWKYAVSLIRKQMESESAAVSQLAQCCYSMARMSVGLVSGIPEWIMRGHFGVISDGDDYRIVEGDMVHEAFPNAILTRVQYLLYSGEFIPAMNLIDLAQNAYHINKMQLYNAYADMFRAICWMHMGDEARMKRYINTALERIAEDRLWVVAAEFSHSLGHHLVDAAREYGEEALHHIVDHGDGMEKRLDVLRQTMTGNKIRESLTNRELAVAKLAAEGIKNREIAERLGITVNTVKYHLSNAYQKMETDDRVKLKDALDKMKRETAIWVNEKK